MAVPGASFGAFPGPRGQARLRPVVWRRLPQPQTGKVRRVGKLILIRPILVGQAPPQNFLSKKTKTCDIVHCVRVHPLREVSRMPDIRQGPKATVREGGISTLPCRQGKTISCREALDKG